MPEIQNCKNQPAPTGQDVLNAVIEANGSAKGLNKILKEAWNATRGETDQIDHFHDALPKGQAYEWRDQEFANWKYLPEPIKAVLKSKGFVCRQTKEQIQALEEEIVQLDPIDDSVPSDIPEPENSPKPIVEETPNQTAIRAHHDRVETGFDPLAPVNGLRNIFSDERTHNQLPDKSDETLDVDEIFNITRRAEGSAINTALGLERNRIGDIKNYLDNLDTGKLGDLQSQVDGLVDDLKATDWSQDFATIEKTRADWRTEQGESHTPLQIKLAEYLEDNGYENLGELREVMANEKQGVGVLRLQTQLTKDGRITKNLDSQEFKNLLSVNKGLKDIYTKMSQERASSLPATMTIGDLLEAARKHLKVNKMPVAVGDLLTIAREKTEKGESFTDAYTIQVDNGPRPNLATLGRALLALAPLVLPPLALGSTGLQLETIFDWEDRKLTDPQDIETAFKEKMGRSLSATERKVLWQFTKTGTLPLDFVGKTLNAVVEHEEKILPVISAKPTSTPGGADKLDVGVDAVPGGQTPVDPNAPADGFGPAAKSFFSKLAFWK